MNQPEDITEPELQFLTLGFNRFYDIYDEVMVDEFWLKDDWDRFSIVYQCFSIYSELLNYEPLKDIIQIIKIKRPPMESEIGGELFEFIRNVLIHFPFYTKWDDIWINKSLVNWNKEGLTIDRFLKKYEGHKEVEYRFHEPKYRRMTYLSINFPSNYSDNAKIFLKDIISEREGIKFSFILMKQILNTQVQEIKYK